MLEPLLRGRSEERNVTKAFHSAKGNGEDAHVNVGLPCMCMLCVPQPMVAYHALSLSADPRASQGRREK